MTHFAEDPGLQLPFDHLKTPGIETRLAAFLFDMPAAPEESLLAAFAIQLARYTGQASIPLVASTASLQLTAARFETGLDLPGEVLIDQARNHLQAQPRSSMGAPLPQPAIFLLSERAAPLDEAAALSLIRSLPDALQAGADLYLVAAREGPNPRVAFGYNANLFEPLTIARFAGHLQTLLPQLLGEPRKPIAQPALMTLEERRAVESFGEGAQRSYPDTVIHRLVERNAAATPHAVAVKFRDETMTYGQLNRCANQLAAYLAARGLGREDKVVVCVEGGFDIMISLLAILKAGAVYVPLDPTYPEERIRAILEDTKPGLVISHTHLVEKLSLGAFPVLRTDVDAGSVSSLPAENPRTEILLQQTAYVYYTSGTTGKPKGVMASHANLIHYILSAQRRYGFNARDVMPAIARFSFSISMFELMSPLVAGGTLILLERDHVVDPARMSQTFQEVTFFHAGPSLLRVVLAYIRLRHADFSAYARVRHASSGGDMVAAELLESLKEIFANAEVFVIYGCSEVSCMGCTYPASRARIIARSYVGGPFDNVKVRILDAQRRPAPFGIAGEICFAGDGVVKGYLNRPELTAEKFVEIEGRRFYCTGDMGRLNTAGDVEILGRRDFQIQLRGMRIELGEIESALRKAPGVANGVVRAWTDSSGEKSLAAYVVFQQGRTVATAAVRQHMLDSLPDYMVPAFYVELPALPLNHNMKVDRYALPSPQAADRRAAASASLRPAETRTERELVEIWKGLLGVEQIGLDDRFIDLGGHSMLLMQLILETERRLAVALEGTDIMEESLEVLASMIDTQLGQPGKGLAAHRARHPDESAASSSGLHPIQREPLSAFRAFVDDLRRHLKTPELSLGRSLRVIRDEYGLQALLAYRLGRSLRAMGGKPWLWPLLVPGWPLYFVLSRYVRAAFDIRLNLSADIGPGLYIGHFGGIALRDCLLGRHCSISQSVRIEPDVEGDGPILGERVWVGAHATVIGAYRIGKGSTVSAAATLRRDLPESTLCMGNPARVVLRDYDNSAILDL